MTLLKQLRDAAMQCSDVSYRALLRATADEGQRVTNEFWQDQTGDNLILLNGMWAVGVRLLKNTPPEAPPAPLAGAPEAARLAA